MNFVLFAGRRLGRVKISMPPSSQVHVSVVGTGAPGTPKSVLICTDSTRYLINCGEGTQRILTEHKSKASKIQHVFFTRMSWRHLSGLLGIALTVKTAGVKKMFVHGPPSVVELMKLTRHFADASTSEVVQSEILQKSIIDNDFYISAFEITDKDLQEPSAKVQKVEAKLDSQPLYTYLFKSLKLKRKLDIEKCIELGVPKEILRSPKMAQLVDGLPLVLEDGRVISPESVTFPSPPPKNILVLECPHESCIPRFLEADSLFNAIAASGGDEGKGQSTLPGITLAIHFVPPGLFETPAYQALVSRLDEFGRVEVDAGSAAASDGNSGDGVHHLVLDGSPNRCPPVAGVFSQSFLLNTYFDSHIYPKLEAYEAFSNKPDLSNVEPFSRVAIAEPMMRYHLRPHLGFNTEHCIVLDEKEMIDQAFEPLHVSQSEAEEEFKKMNAEIGAAVAKRAQDGVKSPFENQPWPEITFLGTASSSPSKYRNISAILVRLSESECMLMDCAEGTLNQFYTLHGVEKTLELLKGLKLILITHMHADHHGGVMTVARKVHDLTGRAVDILAPPPFWRWVQSYENLFLQGRQQQVHLFPINRVYDAPPVPGAVGNGHHQQTVSPIWQLKGREDDPLVPEWLELLQALKLKIEPVRVPHTGTSWAYVVSRPETGDSNSFPPWKIVYSGDTPPCSQLAEAGRDCDLLIHEATMGDGYEEEAVVARHSTTSEAISIGRLMRSKFILLTHFSQRFSRLPSFDSFQEDIAPAFDFMRVRLEELWRLPYLAPYYKLAFAKHWQLLQKRADFRAQKRERVAADLADARSVVSSAIGGVGSRQPKQASDRT